MTLRNKATRIRLSDFSSAPMRAFHMTWLAFFLCFFGWFGIAPLMPVIREEFHLTKAQIGNLTIASVAITVLVRLVIGWLCDRGSLAGEPLRCPIAGSSSGKRIDRGLRRRWISLRRSSL